MKIEIETKYNVGDIVWTAEYNRDELGYCPIKARISGINIMVYDKAVRNISYFIGDIVSYSSDALFVTKAECQVDCDRLNHGIDIDKKVKT